METRKAEISDLVEIMKVMDAARMFQRNIGFIQWKDGYPSADDISKDIQDGRAIVFLQNAEVIGYAYLAVGDKEYESLPDDLWSCTGLYGVVHRLALADKYRGKGLSSEMMAMIEKEYLDHGVDSVRVDTGDANIVMQRIMSACGYENRGLHVFSWGPRLVFEKRLR